MSAALVLVRNPIAPQAGLKRAICDSGMTLHQALMCADWTLPASAVLLRPGLPVHPIDWSKATLDQVLVRRDEWDRVVLNDNDQAIFVTVPQGGKGGSSPLTIIASIAIAVAAFSFGGPLAATVLDAAGITGVSTAAGSLAASIGSATIAISGQLLLSAFLAPPRGFNGAQQSSPTYALSSQSNQARLGQAIGEWFGKNNIYPDLAAAPYSEFEDNQQTVFESFTVGVGKYDFHQLRIDSTVFWEDGNYTGAYPEIEVEFVAPGATGSLFPDNVVTSVEVSSIELKGANEDGYDWSGPFAVSGAGTQASGGAVDIFLPALFKTTDSGNMNAAEVDFNFQAQAIDATGTATGAWFDVIGATSSVSGVLNLASRDTIRKTYRFDFPVAGRYQLRGQRTNERGDKKSTDQIFWVALRGYLPSSTVNAHDTKINLRARATSNLNGSSAQKFNVVATRKLPQYDAESETWSDDVASRRISDAAAYILRSSNCIDLADNRIDLAQLYALETTWTERGDTFNGGFDSQQAGWDMLISVLRAGRTKPVHAGALVTFVRSEAKTTYAGAFGPTSMIAGSFSIKNMFPGSKPVDAILARFIDERTWTQNQVLCALPGSSYTEDTAPAIDVFGITNRAHVWREIIWQVAQNRYYRQFPSFTTPLEGRACFFGDLVKIGHWLADYGATAQVFTLEEDVAGDILTLSEPWITPEGQEGTTPIVRLTSPDGRLYGPVPFAIIDDGSTSRFARIRLLDSDNTMDGKYAGEQPRDWPLWDVDGLRKRRPTAFLGQGTVRPVDAIVARMKPARGMTAQMAFVIEDDRVHSADETGPPAETIPPPAPTATDLTIVSISVRETAYPQGDNVTTKIAVTIAGAPSATSFEIQEKWDGDATYSAPRPVARSFKLDSAVGTLYLKARAVGDSSYGAWFGPETYAADGVPDFGGPLDVGSITTVHGWDDEYATWSWSGVATATSYSVTVEWHDGSVWTTLRTESIAGLSYNYTAAKASVDGLGAGKTIRIGAKGVNSEGSSTNWSYSA